MMRVLVLLMLTLCLLAPVRAEDPVDFPDPVLKEAVEYALWVLDPTPADMLGLTELVWPHVPETKKIRDLSGLKHALNLQTLNLECHGIKDLSALAGLTNLQILTLDGNEIESISALAGLTSLRTLSLLSNDICDISPVSGLVNLSSVSFHRNQVSDISPLAELMSLTRLDLRINPLNREAYDVYIPQIMENNPGIWFVHDPDVVFRVVISSTAGGSVVAPGEGEFLCRYRERISLKAEAAPGFVFGGWSGVDFGTDDSAFFVVVNDYEIQAHFLSLSDTLCVDDDACDDPGPCTAAVSDPQEDGTAAHPFDSIQEALEVAADGASILVCPGTYHENIDFLGKRVQLLGIDANDPGEADCPVIYGVGDGPVVTFAGGEDPNCVLMGFVLTGGRGGPAGGVYCEASSPTIMNCLIVGNRASDRSGAAVYCSDSNAVFVNCTIADNAGGDEGGGLVLEDGGVIVTNSILWGNTPSDILIAGSGGPSITYSDIAGGWPGQGNIDADPLFARPGAWDASGTPVDGSWIDGDYHLQSQAGRWDGLTQAWVCDEATSPCIDAGDPVGPVGDEPGSNGEIVNAGAYGGTISASQSP